MNARLVNSNLYYKLVDNVYVIMLMTIFYTINHAYYVTYHIAQIVQAWLNAKNVMKLITIL